MTHRAFARSLFSFIHTEVGGTPASRSTAAYMTVAVPHALAILLVPGLVAVCKDYRRWVRCVPHR